MKLQQHLQNNRKTRSGTICWELNGMLNDLGWQYNPKSITHPNCGTDNLGIVPLSPLAPCPFLIFPEFCLCHLLPLVVQFLQDDTSIHTTESLHSQENVSNVDRIKGDRRVDQEEWIRPKKGNNPTAGSTYLSCMEDHKEQCQGSC